MRTVFRFALVGFSVLLGAAALLTPLGCGGSSGPPAPGTTVADAGGTWFGPMGMTSDTADPVPPMSSGMITIDGGGMVTAFTLDGVPQPTVGGITGVLDETHRLFSSLFNGQSGIFMMSADKSHLFYFDQSRLVGALQRDGMPAPAYSDADILTTMWSGSVVRVSPLMAPQETELLQGAIIDNLGMWQYMAGASTTNGPALTMVGGTTNGQFRSASTIVNPAGAGFLLLLMTPDKRFVGAVNGWGLYPTDCQFGAWSKN